MAAAQDVSIYQGDVQVADLKLWRVPEQVLVEAQLAAAALQKRIAGKERPVWFNGQQYIENDDWQMLSHFFGYSPKIESTEKFEFGEARGFKACAVLIHEQSGRIVSRGEALCLDEEENWGMRTKYEWQDVFDAGGKKIWDPKGGKQGTGGYLRHKVEVGAVKTPLFQLMSMAETRACNKAMSNKLKWVVSLAGYATTPAEDMHDATLAPEKERPAPLPTEIKKKPVAAAAPQSSGAASSVRTAPVAPPSAASRTPSPAPPAERFHSAAPQPAQKPAPVQIITSKQARRFWAMRKEAKRSDQETKSYLRETFGIEDDRQIPANRYAEACRWAAEAKW